MGLVLGAEATQVRVAIAPAPDRTTRWYGVTASGTQPFAWIVPIARGAAVDAPSSAWLEALDVVSAPRVASSCGGSAMETVRAIELGTDMPLPKLVIVSASSDVDAALAGFYVQDEVRVVLEGILQTHDLAVLRVVAPTPATIRVVDRDTDVRVPMSLVRSPRDVDIVTFVLSDRRAAMGAAVAPPSKIHWFGQHSDYLIARDGVLASAGPGGLLTEAALPSSVLTNQRISPTIVPSLALEYFSRAALYGDATGSLASCLNSASSMGGTVQTPYCARGDLAGSAAFPCSTASGLTCGPHADDLALAMAGRVPQDVWITRFVGRIGANQSAPDFPVTALGGPEVGLLRIAASSCKSPPSGSTPSGGSSGGDVDQGGGCSGSVATSDSTGSSGDDCGSDSSVSDSSGDDCSSDTSNAGDSCDSDTSNAGDSCDSGGGGEDCSGGGGGGGDCAEATPRKNKTAGKSPVSRLALSAALVLLPLRRITRRRR